ncbi:hypothetical protein RRG08_018364 [Elysia crispata]|uniref:Uncharacterized protein n=1 Tax=Elysia crispata TaxID=231223 RepID=A0AAE0YL96_9GAST|nr:hypothetical protein RRG08_018364 [Elysia crispata]
MEPTDWLVAYRFGQCCRNLIIEKQCKELAIRCEKTRAVSEASGAFDGSWASGIGPGISEQFYVAIASLGGIGRETEGENQITVQIDGYRDGTEQKKKRGVIKREPEKK